MDRAKKIFGNRTPQASYKKAVRVKTWYEKKYGSDEERDFCLAAIPAQAIGEIMGVRNLIHSGTMDAVFSDKSIIIGSTRTGCGFYRVAIAMASAAHSLGYEPFWFDLDSFQDSVCGKIIGRQNKLYSFGKILSQKNRVFSSAPCYPLDSAAFRSIGWNAVDQKVTELMAAVYKSLPKDIPFIASHVWAAQAAVHAGMTNVVNAVPDSLPLSVNLAEGALHTVQTPSAYLGYRALRDMDTEKPLRPMPADSVKYAGHFVDHEIVSNILSDCRRRAERARSGKPRRWLISLCETQISLDLLLTAVRRLMPEIRRERAALVIDAGDDMAALDYLCTAIPEMREIMCEHFDDFSDTAYFAASTLDGDMTGLHVFYHSDIFPAVYSANVLMRTCDVLLTSPCELAYYPIPKMIVSNTSCTDCGGAVRSSEVGDGTYECKTAAETEAMLRLIQNSSDVFMNMCRAIVRADKAGIYNGAYNTVKMAINRK